VLSASVPLIVITSKLLFYAGVKYYLLSYDQLVSVALQPD